MIPASANHGGDHLGGVSFIAFTKANNGDATNRCGTSAANYPCIYEATWKYRITNSITASTAGSVAWVETEDDKCYTGSPTVLMDPCNGASGFYVDDEGRDQAPRRNVRIWSDTSAHNAGIFGTFSLGGYQRHATTSPPRIRMCVRLGGIGAEIQCTAWTAAADVVPEGTSATPPDPGTASTTTVTPCLTWSPEGPAVNDTVSLDPRCSTYQAGAMNRLELGDGTVLRAWQESFSPHAHAFTSAGTKVVIVKVRSGGSGTLVREERYSIAVGETTNTHGIDGNFFTLAQQFGECNYIRPSVLLGVAYVESSFGANMGPSSAGAVGPYQFLPSTWADGWARDGDNDGDRDVWSVPDSMLGARDYLKRLLADQGTVSRALLAYNGSLSNPSGYDARVLSYANSVKAEADAACTSGSPEQPVPGSGGDGDPLVDDDDPEDDCSLLNLVCHIGKLLKALFIPETTISERFESIRETAAGHLPFGPVVWAADSAESSFADFRGGATTTGLGTQDCNYGPTIDLEPGEGDSYPENDPYVHIPILGGCSEDLDPIKDITRIASAVLAYIGMALALWKVWGWVIGGGSAPSIAGGGDDG